MRRHLTSLVALASVLLVGAIAVPAPANALSYSFTFSLVNGDNVLPNVVDPSYPDPITGSGIVVVDNSGLITEIDNGLLNGTAITLLAPNGSFNDNLFSSSSPWISTIGLGFTTPDGVEWTIWSNGGSDYAWCNNSGQNVAYQCNSLDGPPANPFDPIQIEGSSFSAAPVPDGETPLPAALPLFATGLGTLGLLGWRRKRKVATAAV